MAVRLEQTSRFFFIRTYVVYEMMQAKRVMNACPLTVNSKIDENIERRHLK